jgi:DNA-binding CsgD family transcriptional regulator
MERLFVTTELMPDERVISVVVHPGEPCRVSLPAPLVGPDARQYTDLEIVVDRLWAPPRGGTPDYADRAPPVPDREAMWPDLTEPLTRRELQVLELLARRFSYREIATRLSISWQTVAKHTRSIYQKLRVGRRREAVERAAALGILPVESGTDVSA